MNNTIKTASANLNKVADSLAKKGVNLAGDIRAIAQTLDTFDQAAMFDPSQEQQMFGQDSGLSMQVNPFAADKSSGEENPKVPIESFVQMPEKEPVSDIKIHTCTVTFKAPPDVAESDMMNYILGIGDELGVEVDSFKWAKLDQKSNSGK